MFSECGKLDEACAGIVDRVVGGVGKQMAAAMPAAFVPFLDAFVKVAVFTTADIRYTMIYKLDPWSTKKKMEQHEITDEI